MLHMKRSSDIHFVLRWIQDANTILSRWSSDIKRAGKCSDWCTGVRKFYKDALKLKPNLVSQGDTFVAQHRYK